MTISTKKFKKKNLFKLERRAAINNSPALCSKKETYLILEVLVLALEAIDFVSEHTKLSFLLKAAFLGRFAILQESGTQRQGEIRFW